MARTVKGSPGARDDRTSASSTRATRRPSTTPLARTWPCPRCAASSARGGPRRAPDVAEDFPVFGREGPTFYFLLGTRNDAKGIASVNHTATFRRRRGRLPLGVRAMATLAWQFLTDPGVAEDRPSRAFPRPDRAQIDPRFARVGLRTTAQVDPRFAGRALLSLY